MRSEAAQLKQPGGPQAGAARIAALEEPRHRSAVVHVDVHLLLPIMARRSIDDVVPQQFVHLRALRAPAAARTLLRIA